MKPSKRKEWLLDWVKRHKVVDVLDSELVDAYIQHTGAKYIPTHWGANHCYQLGRDLAEMAKCSALKRFRLGLGCNWQPGFPKWVYVYEIGPAAYLYEPRPIEGVKP